MAEVWIMDLSEELGRPLTPNELAEILGVAPNTVRKYYQRWDGVMIASGCLRFFEN